MLLAILPLASVHRPSSHISVISLTGSSSKIPKNFEIPKDFLGCEHFKIPLIEVIALEDPVGLLVPLLQYAGPALSTAMWYA